MVGNFSHQAIISRKKQDCKMSLTCSYYLQYDIALRIS